MSLTPALARLKLLHVPYSFAGAVNISAPPSAVPPSHDEQSPYDAVDSDDSASGDGGRARRRTLWVVQENPATSTAFALVLAGYGDAWAAVALGRGMGAAHTLLALQPCDADDTTRGANSARDLAAAYAAALRAHRPVGPYFLGGYSAGALLALETARCLRAQGQDVALLVMLDPLFVRYTGLEQASWTLFEHAVAALAPLFGGLRQYKILTAMTQDQGLQRHLRVLADHVPEPYDGRVTLVEANGSRFLRPPTYIAEWKRVARGGLDRRQPGGTHHSFMRPPHVYVLGRQLGEWIDLATSEASR